MKAILIDGEKKGEAFNVGDGIQMIQIKNPTGSILKYYKTKETIYGAQVFSINEPQSTVRLRRHIAERINAR